MEAGEEEQQTEAEAEADEVEEMDVVEKGSVLVEQGSVATDKMIKRRRRWWWRWRRCSSVL